jgi:hypothetical protein
MEETTGLRNRGIMEGKIGLRNGASLSESTTATTGCVCTLFKLLQADGLVVELDPFVRFLRVCSAGGGLIFLESLFFMQKHRAVQLCCSAEASAIHI